MNNGFAEYKKLILHEFEHLNKRVDTLEDKIDATRIDFATQKGKASVWGALAGMLAAAILTVLVRLLV